MGPVMRGPNDVLFTLPVPAWALAQQQIHGPGGDGGGGPGGDGGGPGGDGGGGGNGGGGHIMPPPLPPGFGGPNNGGNAGNAGGTIMPPPLPPGFNQAGLNQAGLNQAGFNQAGQQQQSLERFPCYAFGKKARDWEIFILLHTAHSESRGRLDVLQDSRLIKRTQNVSANFTIAHLEQTNRLSFTSPRTSFILARS